MKTSIRKLREAIRCSIVENEELLAKWSLGNEKGASNRIGRELAKLGIFPIRRGEEDTFLLGAGAFNEAFDVVYKGKRAVARLSSNPRELTQLLNFLEFKNKLPQQYAKHFPEIYTTFEFELDSGAELSGAVVELLSELPPSLKRDIEFMPQMRAFSSARAHNITENPEFISAVAKRAAPNHKKIQNSIINVFQAEIVPFLQNSIGKSVSDVSNGVRKIINLVKNESPDSTSAYSPSFNAYSDFHLALDKAIRGEVIPQRQKNDEERVSLAKFHTSSAVREFYDFLNALSEAGMKWDDLHIENFMMRKSTGDLVVVDPGLFTK